MDDIVLQAIKKWPNVPACFGWLGLSARGHWYLRDAQAQAAGGFPHSRGSVVQQEKLLAFINRNYAVDTQGRWYFQNGPQRVYVELECTPWVWRIQPNFELLSHTGRAAQATACLLDEQGRVYLATALGLGLVHSLDTALAAEAIERGDWQVQEVLAANLPSQYGFVRSPGLEAAAHEES